MEIHCKGASLIGFPYSGFVSPAPPLCLGFLSGESVSGSLYWGIPSWGLLSGASLMGASVLGIRLRESLLGVPCLGFPILGVPCWRLLIGDSLMVIPCYGGVLGKPYVVGFIMLGCSLLGFP